MDFEDGTLGDTETELHGNSIDVVDSPSGQGRVAEVVFQQEERSEFRFDPVDSGSEHCYSLRYFIPSEANVGGIYTQWHERPDRDLGEDWRKPPAMVIAHDAGFTIHGYHSPNPVNDNDDSIRWADPAGQLGPLARGTWVSFAFHFKWSYGSDGLVEVWRDGERVFSQVGPNTYNDRSGSYWKVGIYDSLGTGGQTRTYYLDDVVQGPAGQDCVRG